MRERCRSAGPKLLVVALLVFGGGHARAEEKSRDSYEEAAMAGFGSTGDHLGTGPLFAFELGGRRQLDAFSVGLALRVQYEQYGSDRAETLMTFEAPITARLGSASGTMLPYAGIAPGLLYDRADIAATIGQAYAAETSGRLSLHGFAGTQLRLGPGGVFLEWGFRVSPVEHRAEGDSSLTSFTGSVGYRLRL